MSKESIGDELKPCPFCGGTEQRVKSSGRWGWFVSCKCCAVGPSAASKDEAIAAWNNRSDDEMYIEALDRVAGKWALDELNRIEGKWVHADAENRALRDLVTDMHRLLQRTCESRDECGRDCELWLDHNKQCELRDMEDRMAVLGIEVLE